MILNSYKGISRWCVVVFLLVINFGAVSASSFDEAMTDYKLGNYDDAYSALLKLGKQGQADAQFRLGIMAYKGQGVVKNYTQSIRWYRLAAENGHAGAQNNLGLIYRDGEGAKQSNVVAYMWFNLAAADNTRAVENRNNLARNLSKKQILQGQQLAAEFAVRMEKHKMAKQKAQQAKREQLLAKIKDEQNRMEQDKKQAEIDKQKKQQQSGLGNWLQNTFSANKPTNKSANSQDEVEVKQSVVQQKPSAGQPVVDQPDVEQSLEQFVVQLGLFAEVGNVDRIRVRLQALKIKLLVEQVAVNGNSYNRLRVGPFSDVDQAYEVSGQMDRVFNIESAVIPLF